MVTMTVFITDARHGDRFTQLRKEIFDNFPASALITVAGLARPEMLVEVSGDRGTWLSQNRETLIVHRAQIPFAREMPGLIVFSDGQRARDRKFADSAGGEWIRTCMGLFLSSRFLGCCQFFVRSGKAVLRPVACD